MVEVTVVCPLYNAEKDIERLDNSLKIQQGVNLEIKYILTESKDETEEYLKEPLH